MALLFIEKISKKEDWNLGISVLFYKWFLYLCPYIIIGDEKGGDSDEDVSNQSYFVKKKNDRISV